MKAVDATRGLARALGRGLADLLLPPCCAGCGAPSGGAPLCRACEPPAPRPWPDRPAPAPLAGWSAAVAYAGAAEGWIRRFKYPPGGLGPGIDAAADAVAEHWIRRAVAAAPGHPPGLVLPVPLHPRRLRERGFNPAGRLAREAAREAAAPLALGALQRVRDTPSQTALGRAARRRNVRGAFRAAGPLPPQVWLVDDVATTGATLAEAARALRRAGARSVVGICLAWRPPPE